MEQRLEDILDRERETLDPAERQASPASRTRSASLQRDAAPLSEAMRKLESYEFEDAEAKADFEELLEEYENIRDLENFQRSQPAPVPRTQEPRTTSRRST